MKIKILIALLFMSSFAGAQSMQQYLKETREITRERKYAEALKRHIWYYNNAEKIEPAISGVRLSFALSDWQKLGEKYPPALAALTKIRDENTKAVITNGGPAEIFRDVAAINRTLKQDDKTITLFKTIVQTHPKEAKQSWYYVRRQLFAAKEYAMIKKFGRSPVEEFERNANVATNPKNFLAAAMLKRNAEKNFVDESLQVIDYAVAVNDLSSAKRIQKEANGVYKSERFATALK